MKRILSLVLAAVFVLSLASCALTEGSDIDKTLEVMNGADTVIVHIYGEKTEESLRIDVSDEFLSLVEGKWESAKGQSGGEKLLTVTIETQHEITFFDNGVALVYYGYANVHERDRRYYTVELENELDSIKAYAEKHGIALEACNALDLVFDSEEKEEDTLLRCEFFGKKETLSAAASEDLKEYLGGSFRARTEEQKDAEKEKDYEPKGKKIFSLVAQDKYKIVLYEGDEAMICELNSQGEEKNVKYYNVSLNGDWEGLYNYFAENGEFLK